MAVLLAGKEWPRREGVVWTEEPSEDSTLVTCRGAERVGRVARDFRQACAMLVTAAVALDAFKRGFG